MSYGQTPCLLQVHSFEGGFTSTAEISFSPWNTAEEYVNAQSTKIIKFTTIIHMTYAAYNKIARIVYA